MTASCNTSKRKSAHSHSSASLPDDPSQMRVYIDWREVVFALQDRNSEITFIELSELARACLTRLEGSINAEVYRAIASRAKSQGVSTLTVDMSA